MFLIQLLSRKGWEYAVDMNTETTLPSKMAVTVVFYAYRVVHFTVLHQRGKLTHKEMNTKRERPCLTLMKNSNTCFT